MVASPTVFREIVMQRPPAPMHKRFHRPLFTARPAPLFTALSAALAFLLAGPALAQPAAQPIVPPPAKPPAAPPKGAGLPPKSSTDMELDPDAAKPPPEPKKDDLPPVDPNAWGVGGKDEEGKFAPQKKAEVKEDDDGPVKPTAPGAAFVDIVAGFGGMRDVTNDQKTTTLTVGSFILGGRYRFGDFTAGLRFPYSTGKIVGPGGATNEFNSFAIGNIELEGRYAFEISRRMHVSPDLAFYLPSASGDLFADSANRGARAQALVNQAAAYSRGFEENPLFAPKRIGIRIGGIFNYDRKEMHVEAGTRIDIMGKTGGNPPSLDASGIAVQYHTPNYTWFTHGSFFYDFLDGMVSPGLRAWLALAQLPAFTATRDYSGAQFVIEPGVQGRFPLNKDGKMAAKGGLGFILPLGGQLGGKDLGGQDSGRAMGFRIHAEFQF